MRTTRETLSGGSLGVVGGLDQLTSRIQRATPRDFIHVSTLADRSGTGDSEASLEGGPKLAASDDGCMSMILSGAGKGGIDVHTTSAAADRSRVKVTGTLKGMGMNPTYLLRRSHGAPHSNTLAGRRRSQATRSFCRPSGGVRLRCDLADRRREDKNHDQRHNVSPCCSTKADLSTYPSGNSVRITRATPVDVLLHPVPTCS
jgi:hypothetical protein